MKPNILYIHSHDTGRYIQPYGYPVPTPNLQLLAEQGVLFRKAFCAAPTCSPSRAALLTGQSAHSSGMLGLAHRGFSLNDYGQHIVSYLKKLGYETALSGVQHVAKNHETIGYNKWLSDGVDYRVADFMLPSINNYLKSKQGSSGNPFFLSVGFVETHREFRSTTALEDPRYTLPPAPIPETPETRLDMAEFKASARVYDNAVGEILGMLDQYGLAENTLVISTTDHGIPFPKMKCNLTDHGMGVMLIMRGPGGFTGGKVVDSMVSHIDIFPTICEVLESEKPDWLQGTSIRPTLEKPTKEIHEAVFSEVTYHAAYEPKRAVRTPRYKYIRHFDDFNTTVMPNCDDGYAKSELSNKGLANRVVEEEYLFDLTFDPCEADNLAELPEMQSILEDMRQKLQDWMVSTNDPILDGLPVKAPKGAVVNPQEQCSPNEATIMVD
jgi:N-sulfoglucosamine sulfohydrolase